VLGAAVYSGNCASCHGADPATNSLNVKAGSTVAGLTAAYQSVGSMNRFSTSLTATDNLNLAAYIASR
jgi:mono/diheme cytochrome c family protein